MPQRIFIFAVLMLALTLWNRPAWAVESETGIDQTQQQEEIYGRELMTPQERSEYREKIGAAKTKEEREKIREEHHASMKKRAEERGLKLPDEPPMRGMGGMEPGKGMGPGGGRKR